MSSLIEEVRQIMVERVLKEYYNDIQDALGQWMCEEITTDELEDVLADLDYVYANKIIRTVNE